MPCSNSLVTASGTLYRRVGALVGPTTLRRPSVSTLPDRPVGRLDGPAAIVYQQEGNVVDWMEHLSEAVSLQSHYAAMMRPRFHLGLGLKT